MKKRLIIQVFLSLLLTLILYPFLHAQEYSLSNFIGQIQNSLTQKNIVAYLENFAHDIRSVEETSFKNIFDLFKMEKATLYKMSDRIQNENNAEIFLQVLFQNSYSAIIETWHLELLKVDSQWQITKKIVAGNIGSLYKIQIPSDRVERVESIEVEHEDIKLIFKDAWLFYDNVPELETALLIIGKGDVRFFPSDPIERHQLKLSYKKEFLEDKLTYACLRFSNHFFQNNIKINKSPEWKNFEPSSEERSAARSIFFKHYPRSFTVENSLNKELFSTLPQGDEAVFGFRGEKLGTFTYVYSPFTDEEINLYRWKDKQIINLYSPASEGKEKRLFLSFGQMFKVKSYQIDLDFKPERYFLSGKAKIEVESQVDSLQKLKLKLNPKLNILRIQDEEGRSLFYSQDKLREILYVYFIHSPPKNKPYSIEVFYRGKLRPPVEITDAVAPPQITRRDDPGRKLSVIDVKFETYLFSQRAKWYPSPSGNDYFRARLKISIPAVYQCISNGEMIETSLLNSADKARQGNKTENSVYIFDVKYPVKYLSFIIGKFTNVGEDHDSLPLQHFYSTGVLFEKKGLLREAKSIVQFFEEKFGTYPYEKLSVVRRLWTTFGGHSPASFIIINELYQTPDSPLLVPVRSPVDLSRWREYFIAHEISHQWWGQAVTWKTYHDVWLSEGLAQFSAIQYLSQKHGKEVLEPIFGKLSHWTEKMSKWGPITLGARLALHDPMAFQTIIYNKTALALNMLKDLLGEEIFFNGLKEFYRRHKYGTASTSVFIKAMEEASGKDLRVFFKNWFSSYTLPKVKVFHSIQRSGDGYILRLRINQMKDVFIFPLWIEWKENGDRVRRMVVVDEKNEEFEIELRVKPQRIEVNPDNAVPGKFH
ncbi:MAG: M1 family aminopeptidase [Candidatus Aminicenantes bacterium]|jgi:hypothetical protein